MALSDEKRGKNEAMVTNIMKLFKEHGKTQSHFFTSVKMHFNLKIRLFY
jgi:hypothetical protein